MVNRWTPHDAGRTVLFSAEENREHHGFVIWVHRNIAPCLLSYNTVSSRVMSAMFAVKPRNVTVIQCYAPAADRTDEETEEFYQQLDDTLTEIGKKNITMITGDFNARVGEDATESDVLGKYGHGKRNEKLLC